MKNVFVAASLVAMAVASVPASAVTVVNATSVRITNAIPTWLQVAEVQALSFGAVNVAAASNGGTALGSAEYENNGFATPDKAIDGDTGGNYFSDFIYHSGTTAGDQFLTVTFAAPTTLSSLTVFGRTDCCNDRDSYKYEIFGINGVLLTSGTVSGVGGPGTVTFDAPSLVPEPQSWALLIAGFGLIGTAMRRRARVSIAV